MRLAVVVPTFNSADCIHACVSSIRARLPDAEIIVVDNGSTDDTCARVREFMPTVTLLHGHGNMGFGFACNLGTERASGDYVMYLNPDAEVVSVDQDEFIGLLRISPFGMLSAMLAENGGPPRPTLRRQPGHWLFEFIGVRLLGILSRYAPAPRYVEKVEGPGTYTISGAACLVSRGEFQSLKGFDERFFMYYEDTDLTQRYLHQGYPLRSTAALVVAHTGGASAPTPQRLALSFLGWIEYVNKWNGAAAARRAAITARIAYSLVLAILRSTARVTGSSSVRAKVEQLHEMLGAIAAVCTGDGSVGERRRYPAATKIAGRIFRSFSPG